MWRDESVSCEGDREHALKKRNVQWRRAWWIRVEDGPDPDRAKKRCRAV